MVIYAVYREAICTKKSLSGGLRSILLRQNGDCISLPTDKQSKNECTMSILTWIEDKKRRNLLNAPKYVARSADASKGLWTRCDKCGVILYIKHLKENQRVCFGCSYHLQMMSQERIENLLDKVPSTSSRSSSCRAMPLGQKGARQESSRTKASRPSYRDNVVSTWRPLDETVSPCDPLKFHDQKNYTDRLKDAQERTGLQDAIQTGTGMIDGIPVALAVMDFSFMGGSMGSVVGEKITRLIEYATAEGLTLLIVSASGGARMQEGVFSLMQMAKVSSALQIYQSCAKLLYISILTSPTTGGVTASFAMLGDVIFAEPKALIAFAGRRVIEQTLAEDLPEDFQTSESMLHHGLVDLIVPRRFLRQAVSETIRLYQNAPFKKVGTIPFGVQNPISFLAEEKVRRQWSPLTKLGTKQFVLDAANPPSFSQRAPYRTQCDALPSFACKSQSLPYKSSFVPYTSKFCGAKSRGARICTRASYSYMGQPRAGHCRAPRNIGGKKIGVTSCPLLAPTCPYGARHGKVRVCTCVGNTDSFFREDGSLPYVKVERERNSGGTTNKVAAGGSEERRYGAYREILTSFEMMLDLFRSGKGIKNWVTDFTIEREQALRSPKESSILAKQIERRSIGGNKAAVMPCGFASHNLRAPTCLTNIGGKACTCPFLPVRAFSCPCTYVQRARQVPATGTASTCNPITIYGPSSHGTYVHEKFCSAKLLFVRQSPGVPVPISLPVQARQSRGRTCPSINIYGARNEMGTGKHGQNKAARNGTARLTNRRSVSWPLRGEKQNKKAWQRDLYEWAVVGQSSRNGSSPTGRASNFHRRESKIKNSCRFFNGTQKRLYKKLAKDVYNVRLQSRDNWSNRNGAASNNRPVSSTGIRVPIFFPMHPLDAQSGLAYKSSLCEIFYKSSLRDIFYKSSLCGILLRNGYKEKILFSKDIVLFAANKKLTRDLPGSFSPMLARRSMPRQVYQRGVHPNLACKIENRFTLLHDFRSFSERFAYKGLSRKEKNRNPLSQPSKKRLPCRAKLAYQSRQSTATRIKDLSGQVFGKICNSTGRNADINFLNRAIELAATDSVEWRAFYIHQQLSENMGFLEEFLQQDHDSRRKNGNLLFYRSICRTEKALNS